VKRLIFLYEETGKHYSVIQVGQHDAGG